ncbi:MAG: tetratricopeptide (TPR) repeat protein, partial [Candidatus Krumholzibacteriia bacterium]
SCAQYLVVAETDGTTRLEATESHRLTQYAGRSTEFEILTKRYRQSLAGAGQFVSVVGEAGLGKSRFLHEFKASINVNDVTILTGSCQSFSDQIAYFPFTDLLRSILGLPKGQVNAEHLRSAHLQLGELDTDLLDYFPFLLQALSIESEDYSLPSELRKESLRATISEAVASLIMCQTAKRPMVLLFEDWHWVDAASADVLDQLVRFSPSHAILILLTHRPSMRIELNDHAHHTVIQLRPLDLEESSAILHTLLGTEEVSTELTALIHERTGGNPFFLEEICQSLLEQRALEPNDKRSVDLSGGEDFKIPDTVQGVIRARLDRMNTDDREVLCFASVIGRDFDQDILNRVYNGDAIIDESLERLCLAGLIQPTKILPRPSYRFKHALTQEVTYESLLTRLRQELHGLVGSAIVALRVERLDQYYSLLAQHFAKAERWLEATEYGLKSAESAWRLTEFQESLKLLEAAEKWAHNITDETERRKRLVPILLRKERAFELFGSRRLQHVVIEELLKLLDPIANKKELIEVHIRLGDLHTFKQDFTGAEGYFHKSLALCDEVGDENGRRQAMRSLGLMMWHADRGEDAVRTMRQSLAEGRKAHDDHQLVMDMVNLSTVYRGLNRVDDSREILTEADSIATDAGDIYGRSYVRHNIAIIARHEGRLDDALEILLSLLDESKITISLPQQQGFHLLTCANIYLQLGRTEDAAASWERALEILRRAKHIDGLSRALVTFADVLLGLNRPGEARDHLVEAREISAQLEDSEMRTKIFYSLGLAHAALDEYPDAIAAWGRARALCHQQANFELELDVVSAMAQTTRKLVPEPTFALQYYRDAIDLAARTSSCKRQGALQNTVGIIEWQRQNYEAALEAYESARKLFEECADHAGLGLVLSSMGVTLHKLGRPEAAAQLRAAVAFNQKYGNRQLEGLALSALGDVQAEAGHPREAIAMYSQSLGIRKETQDRLGEGWMLHHLARAHAQLGALDRTRDFITAAQMIAIELDNVELLNSLSELSK